MSDTSTWVTRPRMSDDAIRKGTGHDWGAWVDVLDTWSATSRSHAEIARHLVEEHRVDGWWAQTITVGYEQIRGMRKVNERLDGFSMNVSKTVPVTVATLFNLFVDDAKRSAWLGDGVLDVRTSVPVKSARFNIIESGGILAATFIDKGEKSAVQLQLNRIPTREELESHKATWKSRLNTLSQSIHAFLQGTS